MSALSTLSKMARLPKRRPSSSYQAEHRGQPNSIGSTSRTSCNASEKSSGSRDPLCRMRDSQNIESKLLDLADDGFRAHTVEGIHKSDLHKAKNLPISLLHVASELLTG